MDIQKVLKKMRACDDAVKWADGKTMPKKAWEACERGDWLLWVAGRLGVDRKLVVLASVKCARLALKHWTKDESLKTNLAVIERWSKGKATDGEMMAAREKLLSIRRTAAYAADLAAGFAAAAAADAAAPAADADAAYAAAFAAESADAAAAGVRSKTLKRCAAIVRAVISWETIKPLLPKE